jgi:hypothetical protein
LTIKLLDGAEDPDRITVRYPLPARDARFRVSGSPIPRTVAHVTQPVRFLGQERNLWEVTFDVSNASRVEPLTLEVEVLVPRAAMPRTFVETQGRYTIATESKTDLLSVWLLFPSDRPYRSYSLVRYPADRSTPPEVMPSRFTIDHPYGTLIGWSVINPDVNTHYECRWSRE